MKRHVYAPDYATIMHLAKSLFDEADRWPDGTDLHQQAEHEPHEVRRAILHAFATRVREARRRRFLDAAASYHCAARATRPDSHEETRALQLAWYATERAHGRNPDPELNDDRGGNR